ncbi:2'-5' RNA ligase family protein [Cryobacterium sp. CG_9.6]|uniref:2'-5' RNA ligase family protein n=1 Tax=Cryobacterium sp. CG_9.6 TaxID=2760710 RepID=UPI002475FF40|nr:2'-5' RNA ligase family protein [Cryobacterium sp. CG_9.6]MDH6237109.1 hypothetical protein [Cryobacterium sp. CG_9.6]
MQHYVVVLPVKPLSVGEGFPVDQWPLHVTLVPNFHTRSTSAEIEKTIEVARPLGLCVRVGAEEMFGGSGSIPANIVLDESGTLTRLHNRLLTTLEERCGLTLDNPQYFRAGYRPHITVTRAEHAEPGALIYLNQLALVDMQPRGTAGNPTVVSTMNIDLTSS